MKNRLEQGNISIFRVITKVITILAIINFGWIFVPQDILAGLNVYNRILPGRDRLPFGEQPEKSYNLSLYNIESMFASHKIDKHNKQDSYTVVLAGDSSVWGFLQKPEQNIGGILTRELQEQGVQVYNLGYPSISVLKDLLLVDHAMRYDPDLVIWFTTLEALPIDKQLQTPINQNNPGKANGLIEKYDLHINKLPTGNIFDKTFFSQRRNIFDVFRLQLYGFMWAATGIDQDYPAEYQPAQRDFAKDDHDFYNLGPNDMVYFEQSLALDIIQKGIRSNPQTDFIVINEPILISAGENSEVRYNFYYPRWAYDTYRQIINNLCSENDIEYYDLWDSIPEDEFTNSAIHMTASGEELFAQQVIQIITDHIGE